MMKTLTILTAVATASALPASILKDVSCQGAENVTMCEVDFHVCKTLFSVDQDEQIRKHRYKSCLDENGFNQLDDVDPEVLLTPTGPEALSLFGSEEKHKALRPDGTVDPQPFLERLTLALTDTRPDILERLLYTADSCPIKNINDWKTCVLSGCVREDLATGTTPVPTTLASENE
ncbi:uncharacterized protein LOC122262986 [Penaeus japonicus]|uniref:uncharacterized protein LOC122262986 n=1 Tax=Penaeus japonicus TaxID=27405 RepID=UPI001C7152B3|nr:uncharacterized protein LOC122262986 [Penaeus japonicus]